MKSIVQAEPKTAAERTEYQEFVTPVVNIFETKDGYALEAEMPGVNKDGLEITLEGNEITISGSAHIRTQRWRGVVPGTFRGGLPAGVRTRSGD